MPVLGDISPFPWLDSTQKKASEKDDRRTRVATEELASRAGLMFRLGYTQQDATARLCQRTAWEFDSGHRPASLSDDAVTKIVAETYARRPK
jgi:hypothetical protein